MNEQTCEDIKCVAVKDTLVNVPLKILNTGTEADFKECFTLGNEKRAKKKADKYDIFDILGKDIIVHFGDNKVATTNIITVITAIAEIHRRSAIKHPLHDWEKQVSIAIDNTVSNNLGAMFRHLYKIHQGEETDQESGCPHWAHFACRWQMAITAALRMNVNGTYRVYDLTVTPPVTDCALYGCISPETIYVLGHIEKPALVGRLHSMLEHTKDANTREMMYMLCEKGGNIINFLSNSSCKTGNPLSEIFELSRWVIAYSLISACPFIKEAGEIKESNSDDGKKPWDYVSVF